MIAENNVLMFTVFVIFGLAAAIQLFYYLYFYLAIPLYKYPEKVTNTEPVSIIICARNESENLRNFLPAILEQDYPAFEVIVVNDCSEDSSDDVLGGLLMKYPHLRISSINKDPKFTHNKKFAQFIGIKAASNEILLFTDADCRPESDQWLSGMVSNFNEKTDFVLGYGGYFYKKGLLNSYIRYDTMFIAMQYLGMALRGVPYMGVGRNLAYRRSVFFKNKGFGAHNNLISGDDDLFVNSNANKSNTTVEFRKETFTRSVSASDFKEWIKQKKRHLTTGKYYKLRDKLLLLTELTSRILFYATFIAVISVLYHWPFALAVFSLRLITQLVVQSLIQQRLNEQKLLFFSIFFDIFSIPLNMILYLGNYRNKSGRSTWK
jgi:poly-beta-1,6-N-acetyl-D-glucosamine synthase